MTPLEKYDELRAAQKEANSALVKALPTGAKGRAILHRAAKTIHHRMRNGNVDTTDEAALDRLFEFILYEPALGKPIWAQQVLRGHHSFSDMQVAVVQAAIDAVPTVYEVLDTDRAEKRILLRDILLDLPDVAVYDRRLSANIEPETVVFSRVLTVGEISFLSGTGIAFGPRERETVLARARSLQRIGNGEIRRRKRFALFCEMEKYSSIRLRFA